MLLSNKEGTGESSHYVLWLPLVHPTWLPNKRKHGPPGAPGAEPSPPTLTPSESLMTCPSPFSQRPLLDFSLEMSPAPSQGGQSCCLVLRTMCPARAGRGDRGRGRSGGRGGPPTITSRSPLVMDSSSTRNCKSSTFLQGERGLSRLGSEPWASPRAQTTQKAPTVPESWLMGRASWKPLALPAAGPVLHSETTGFSKTGRVRRHPSSLGWLWDGVAGGAVLLLHEQSAGREGGSVGLFPCQPHSRPLPAESGRQSPGAAPR